MTVKQLCTGELTGILKLTENTITRSSNNHIFIVKLSKRFKSYLQQCSDEIKKDITDRERTYAVLPKTLSYYPYLIFEILGVESSGVSHNDRACVVGELDHTNEYGSLIKVHKSTIKPGDDKVTHSSFLFRVIGLADSVDSNDQLLKGSLWSLKLYLDDKNEYIVKESKLIKQA